MIEPDYIDMLRNQGVRAELFESDVHRKLFEAAEKQYRVSGTIEVTELYSAFDSIVCEPELVLSDILCATATTAGIESWIRIFKSDAAKAALVRAAETVKAEPDAAKALDLWLKAESEAQEIMAGANTKTTRELAAEMIDQIQSVLSLFELLSREFKALGIFRKLSVEVIEQAVRIQKLAIKLGRTLVEI